MLSHVLIVPREQAEGLVAYGAAVSVALRKWKMVSMENLKNCFCYNNTCHLHVA